MAHVSEKELWEYIQKTVPHLARSWKLSAEDVEDAASEVYLRVSVFTLDTRWRGYVQSTFLRLMIDQRRKKGRRVDEVKADVSGSRFEPREYQPSVNAEELIGQVRPTDQPYLLLMLDGFTEREIATIMGISHQRVNSRLRRIKKFIIDEYFGGK